MNATVHVTHLQFSFAFRLPNRAATDLLKSTVPAWAREYDETAQLWRVYSSVVPALSKALTIAGCLVEERPT